MGKMAWEPDPRPHKIDLDRSDASESVPTLPNFPSSKQQAHNYIQAQLLTDRRKLDYPACVSITTEIVDALSLPALSDFISFTLPVVVSSKVQPALSGGNLIRMLRECLHCGALTAALPRILRESPSIAIPVIAGRIELITELLGNTAPDFFGEIFPELLDSDHTSPEKPFFFVVQQFCQLFKGHTVDAARLLQRMVGGTPLTLSSLQIATQACIQIHSDPTGSQALACLDFCSSLVDTLARQSQPETAVVFAAGSTLWTTFAFSGPKGLCDDVVATLRLFSGAVLPSNLAPLFQKIISARISPGIFDPTIASLVAPHFDRFLEVIDILAVLTDHFPDRWHRSLTRYFMRASQKEEMPRYQALLSSLLNQGFSVPQIGANLDFLTDAVDRFPSSELANLVKDPDSIRQARWDFFDCDENLDNSLLHYIVTSFITRGSDPFHPFPASPNEFHERWQSRILTPLPPAFTLDDVSITIPIAPPGETVQIKPGKRLHYLFLNDEMSRFRTPSNAVQQTILRNLEGTLRKEGLEVPLANVGDIFQLLTQASKILGRQAYVQFIQRSFPLLTKAAAIRLFDFNSKKHTEDDCYDYLVSLHSFIEDSVEMPLLQLGMDRQSLNEIKREARLKKVRREISKFIKSTASETCTIHLETGLKTARDEFYDLTGETCIFLHCGSDLDLPFFQPVRLVDRSAMQILGCLYMLRRPVLGCESLIMAGGGLRPSILKAVNTRVFYRELIEKLKVAAQEMGLGGLYCAVGGPSEIAHWTPEGRVAQTKEAIRWIIPSHPKVIHLRAHEHIAFPKGYRYGDISHVIAL